MGGQPVTEASTYTGQHEHINTRETSMPQVRLEPAIPATRWSKTYTLDRAATGIDR
jgi:hypothetical protein